MDLNSTSDSVISHTRCPQNFAGRGRGAGDKGGTGLVPGSPLYILLMIIES